MEDVLRIDYKNERSQLFFTHRAWDEITRMSGVMVRGAVNRGDHAAVAIQRHHNDTKADPRPIRIEQFRFRKRGFQSVE